jgi:hypothetical protein
MPSGPETLTELTESSGTEAEDIIIEVDESGGSARRQRIESPV